MSGMMTRALHSEGWTCSLEKSKKKLWGVCAVPRLQELGACLASCGCPPPSWLLSLGHPAGHIGRTNYVQPQRCKDLPALWVRGKNCNCWNCCRFWRLSRSASVLELGVSCLTDTTTTTATATTQKREF